MGECDHPDSSVVELKNVSHVVKEAYMQGDVVYGAIEILDTPSGKIIQSLIESGVTLGISSRGVGSTKRQGNSQIVQDDFQLICFDMVSEPSTPGAFVMKEGKTISQKDLKHTFNKSDRLNRIFNEIKNGNKMEKLFRSELKSIVKECLVEILSEGLLHDNSNSIQESINRKNFTKKPSKRTSHLDKITFGQSNKKNTNRKINANIDTNITSNPIINSMLKDTALSTLQEQASAEKNPYAAAAARQGDQATKIVNSSSPESLFGEASDKWASLAFS